MRCERRRKINFNSIISPTRIIFASSFFTYNLQWVIFIQKKISLSERTEEKTFPFMEHKLKQCFSLMLFQGNEIDEKDEEKFKLSLISHENLPNYEFLMPLNSNTCNSAMDCIGIVYLKTLEKHWMKEKMNNSLIFTWWRMKQTKKICIRI